MKGYWSRQGKINRKQKGLLLIAFVLTAAALITGLTVAKYVHQWESDPALASTKEFYFTSDLDVYKRQPSYSVCPSYCMGKGRPKNKAASQKRFRASGFCVFCRI